jgi:hypothetical protein
MLPLLLQCCCCCCCSRCTFTALMGVTQPQGGACCLQLGSS